MNRVLAVIYAVPGIGWTVSTLAVLVYQLQNGALPMVFGLRMLGGPFPEITTDRLTPLGWVLAGVLIVVSIVDVAIGRWLWQGKPRGVTLALALAPVSFVLGWLFALPYLLLMAPLRAVLAVLVRRGANNAFGVVRQG